MSDSVYAGIHPSFTGEIFSKSEYDIIRKISTEWYITNGSSVCISPKSTYKYFIAKPTENYQQLFGIEREVIFLFNEYESFEPRALDAFDAIAPKLQEHRLDKICSVLISNDDNICEKVSSYINGDPECQTIVPFTYAEIKYKWTGYLLRKRFEDYLFSRNLFSINSPLKKDIQFFGRTDILNKLYNKHMNGENSGIFGLRKTGKTSII